MQLHPDIACLYQRVTLVTGRVQVVERIERSHAQCLLLGLRHHADSEWVVDEQVGQQVGDCCWNVRFERRQHPASGQRQDPSIPRRCAALRHRDRPRKQGEFSFYVFFSLNSHS